MSSITQVPDLVARQPVYDRRRRVLHALLRGIGFRLCNVDAEGLQHIPASGPTILMMNHVSFIDPIVLTAIVPHRYVISMAKAEVVENWFFRTFVNLWGNYVVHRGEVDRTALTNSIELLKSGQLVLIAPEGTRNPQGLEEPRDGMAYIAAHAGATIVPSAVMGVHDWGQRVKRWRRAYARVHFGRPFRFRSGGDGERLNKGTRAGMMREAMYQLAQLFPEPYAALRGRYADLSQATTQYLEFV